MTSQACKTMKDANRKLALLLDSIRGNETGQIALTAQHLSAILTEVSRGGEWMGVRIAAESDDELRRELDSYCCNLHVLRETMPQIHARLLTERARLEAERAHLDAAAAWARGVRSTS